MKNTRYTKKHKNVTHNQKKTHRFWDNPNVWIWKQELLKSYNKYFQEPQGKRVLIGEYEEKILNYKKASNKIL